MNETIEKEPKSLIQEGTKFPYYSKRGLVFYKAISRNETLKACSYSGHEEIASQIFDSIESDAAFQAECEPSNESEFHHAFYKAMDRLLLKA